MQKTIILFLYSIIFTSSIFSQNIDSLKSILPKQLDTEKVDVLNLIANESKPISTDSVLIYSQKALQLAKDLNYHSGQSTALANLAFVSTFKGEKEKAIELIQEAISINKVYNNTEDEVENTIFLANVYMQFENFEHATEKYIYALKFFESQNDTFRIAQIKGNLGVVYAKIQDFDNALKYFLDTAELRKMLKDYYGEAIINGNIGYLYFLEKDYSKAIPHFLDALNYYLENNHYKLIATSYSHLGQCYSEMGNKKKGLSYLLQAVKFNDKSDANIQNAHNYIKIAEIYLGLGDLTKCKEYLDLTFEVNKKNDIQSNLAKYYKLLSKYYLHINNKNKTIEFFEKYETIKDSINNLHRHNQISDLRTKYESEKKENENAQLKTKLEAEAKEKKLQSILIISISVLFLFVLISGFFIYRSLKQKNELLAKENKINEIEKESIKQETIAIQNAEFSRKLIENQEQERERIAGELHDGIGQDLIIANNKILLGIKEPDSKKSKELFNSVSEYLNKLSDDVSKISHELHPQELVQLGFGLAIESMVNRLMEVSDIKFSLAADEINDCLNKEEEINYFRIIQEALNNIVKHSQADKAWIRIVKNENNIFIEIKDNGQGFDLQSNKELNRDRPQFGLKSMAQRAKLIGGKLQIESEFNIGTTISINFKSSESGKNN